MHFIAKHKLTILITLIFCVLILVGIWFLQDFQKELNSGQSYDYRSRAEESLKKGDYHEAFVLYQKAETVDPTNKILYQKKQADIAFLNGDYSIAILLYQEAGITEKESAEIHYYQSLQALANQEMNEALSQASAAENYIDEERPVTSEMLETLQNKIRELNEQPNKVLQHAQIGKYLIEQKALDLAEESLIDLVTKEPDYRDAHYLLGVAYLTKGDVENAKASLENALEIDDSFEPAKKLLEGLQ